MTLVAALSGRDGTILFADTEETVAGYAKRTIDKLAVFEGEEFRFGIAGACSDGNYADMLQAELSDALCEIREFDLGKIKLGITEVLTNFYTKHVCPRAGQTPEVEYLLVVQPLSGGYPAVIHIAETAANVCIEETKTIGAGSYLADYILKCMTAGDLPFPPSETVDFMCASAVYVAKEVQDNILGVGQLKRVAVFNTDGTYDDLWPIDIVRIEEAVSSIGEFLHYFYSDALHADAAKVMDSTTADWASDIAEGIRKWYTAWNSSEERKRRQTVRELEGRKRRAANE
jgi:hypothetical protein